MNPALRRRPILLPDVRNPMPHSELHCLTNFSFHHGAAHPEEFAERAAALGYTALAITDECSLAGVVRAHLEIRKQNLKLKLIIGTEITLAEGPKLVLLATDRAGYGRLSQLITLGRRRADKGRYRLTMADLDDGLPGCLALLLAPEGVPEVAPLVEAARWLKARFEGDCWLGVSRTLGAQDDARLAALRKVGEATGLPLVAATGALMHVAARRPLADALAALRLHCTVAEAGLALAANAERRLHSRRALARRYPRDLLAETLVVAARCHFSLDELRYEYPAELVPAGETAPGWLRRLTEGGLTWRYSGADHYASHPEPGMSERPAPGDDAAPAKVRALIEHELALIAELGYEPYFLTVFDIVAFARRRGILCQGRGSAANSVVCWALGITEVNPELGIMLIERFISKERAEPPDIDVDFEHERREEVIQYLYAKYGRERAALAATVISYRPRSALRDIGRALGIDPGIIDRLARGHAWWDGRQIDPERLREAGLDPASPVVARLVALTGELLGFPRHLSQHVGGFVIARGRLDALVPVENAAMEERTIIQWDKDDLDALGLLKVDVLALGMLSALSRCLAMISAWRGRPMGLAEIPREVPGVYDMLCDADSVGVFQVESRAQMTMLPRLKPRRFYDLVVEVAIVRPGPIQGGMVHPYLKARERVARGEAIDYPRPDPARACERGGDIRAVLERTLGVPIFQEQVMQLAIVAAGFSPGEADQLRRSMGAWRRQGELERYQQQLIDGMLARGYAPEFAGQICKQIQGFGSYGFPESHAASFALLVYFSSWLKRFEPAAFLCGLLNSQPMGFYPPSQLIQDARRHGVAVLAPDVTVSGWDCGLEASRSGGIHSALQGGDDASVGRDSSRPGRPKAADEPAARWRAHADGGMNPALPDPLAAYRLAQRPAARLGLRMVRGLPLAAAERIVVARAEAPFADVDDLAARAGLDLRELRLLAAADALRALAGHRRQALWQAAGERPVSGVLAEAPVAEAPLALPEASEGQALVADYAALGFTLGRHPLALLRERLAALRFEPTQAFNDSPDRKLARVAGIVTCRQRPGTAKGTMFITLEDETGLANVIVHEALVSRQRRELMGARLLGVFGQTSRQGKVVHLIASRVVDHSALLGRLDTRSRNFH